MPLLPTLSNYDAHKPSPPFIMSDGEHSYHPGGVFNMDPSYLLPDDAEGVYRPILCPNCHIQLPSCQVNGYLCQGPQGSCLRDLSPPRRLMFIEAALGNCAGRCRGRLSEEERAEQTVVCGSCIEKYEPLVRDLLRRVEENLTARHTPLDRGNGLEGICGNPQCEETCPEEDLYSYPNELEHNLATICPKCYATAALVSLGRPALERQMEVLLRASATVDIKDVDFESMFIVDETVPSSIESTEGGHEGGDSANEGNNFGFDSVDDGDEREDSGYGGSDRAEEEFDIEDFLVDPVFDLEGMDMDSDPLQMEFGFEGVNLLAGGMSNSWWDSVGLGFDMMDFGSDMDQVSAPVA